jgi:hypothetical protein
MAESRRTNFSLREYLGTTDIGEAPSAWFPRLRIAQRILCSLHNMCEFHNAGGNHYEPVSIAVVQDLQRLPDSTAADARFVVLDVTSNIVSGGYPPKQQTSYNNLSQEVGGKYRFPKQRNSSTSSGGRSQHTSMVMNNHDQKPQIKYCFVQYR